MQLSRLSYPPLHQVRISPCKLHCYCLPAYGRCTSLCCRSWLCQVPLTWTKRPETLSFWVFLTRPLLQIHLHPVSCDHSRIESSLGTLSLNRLKLLQALRWRTLNLAPTGSPLPSEDCLFLKYVQKYSWCHSIYSWDFCIVAPHSSKKDLPVVVWFPGFVILVIFPQVRVLEASQRRLLHRKRLHVQWEWSDAPSGRWSYRRGHTIPSGCLRIPRRPKGSWQRHFKRRTLWVEFKTGGIS